MRARFLACGLAVLCQAACGQSGSTGNSAQTPPPPPVERLISGTVSEIDGSPVAGVQVSTLSGETTAITDANGSFSLAINSSVVLLHFAREGYEPRDWGMSSDDVPAMLNVLMQRVLVLSDVRPVADVLSPADLSAYVGEVDESDYCGPCKIVRLRSQHQAVSVQVRWSGDQSLQLWESDSRAVQSGPFTANDRPHTDVARDDLARSSSMGESNETGARTPKGF